MEVDTVPGIIFKGHTELHTFIPGPLMERDTETRFCYSIHVKLFRGAFGPNFIFLDESMIA